MKFPKNEVPFKVHSNNNLHVCVNIARNNRGKTTLVEYLFLCQIFI
jgi:hypothetical protein